MTVDVDVRAELAAGLLSSDTAPLDAAAQLRRILHPSTVWQSGDLPPGLRGDVAHGDELARWSPPGALAPAEAQRLADAWSAALPPLDRGMLGYLRLRVDLPADVRQLRRIGAVDGLTIVPSLDPLSTRPVRWRWPFRLGVVPGPFSGAVLAVARGSEHFGYVFDAEPLVPGQEYDIAIVDASGLGALTPAVADQLGATTCVIAAGGPADLVLDELQRSVGPGIAVAVDAPPDLWWRTFFHELSHDVPVDVAVERIVRVHGVDALVAGPRRGMDVTASAHWFAAVAPEFAQLAPMLDQFASWDWRYESGGTRFETDQVRLLRAGGEDPVVTVAQPAMAAPIEADLEVEEPVPPPRRLVARVFGDDTRITTILPPARDLVLAVLVAIPDHDDVAADGPALAVPPAPGPTAELEVSVSGTVWAAPPAKQTISLSRVRADKPSTPALFGFTTPAAGSVVTIEVLVSFQGKPLQAATYVSPVRDLALPGERPTLTTHTLSGPDEPTGNMRPIDVTLDGRGAELRSLADDAVVVLDDVQDVLDSIERRISKVLGVPGAPNRFVGPDGRADAGVLELVIALAGMGGALGDHLAPLQLGAARSINLLVNPTTRVLPLELVYAGPVPDKTAQFCAHVTGTPPAPGEVCTKASRRRVCPYAFWGLHRSISRTVQWTDRRTAQPWTTTLSTARVLYAATEIADEGAADPLPSDSVLAAAERLFRPVTRVTSWTGWRRVVRTDRPNLLVVLGHTMVEGGDTNLYIGRRSVLARFRISASELRSTGTPRPLVLLIACATAALGDAFGSLPGTLTAKGAGAVVATLSKIVGPQGATATNHLLQALHGLAGSDASVGDAVATARRSLLAEGSPIGLVLVSHGEMDTTVGA